MKTLQLEIRNGETVFNHQVSIDNSSKARITDSKVLGTAMHKLFGLVKMQSNGSVNKLFDLRQPFDLKVTYGEVSIDTYSLATELKTKFKLNSSPKRQRKFAQNVWAIINWSTEQTEFKTIDQVEQELTKLIGE